MRTIVINNPGPQGPVGPIGPSGSQGPSGSPGASGSQGPSGSVGPSGPTGSSAPFTNIGGDIFTTTSSLQVSGSFLVSGSSTFTNIGPAIFSGSADITGATTMSSAIVTGNVTVLGTASIGTLVVNQTVLSTGSNQLGDAANDTQTLYGSVIIPTGSLTVTGSTVISSSASTQLQVGSNFLFVSSSGNVGIGTSTPTGSLHIVDAGTSSTIPLQINQYFRFRGDGVMRWGIGMAQGILTWDTGKATIGALSGNNLEIFAGGSTKIFVSSSGNVGIGTTTPTTLLHISGSSNSALLEIDSPTVNNILYVSGSGNIGISTNTSAYRLQINASGSSDSSLPLALTTVDTNNRVGILFASSSISSGRQHRLLHRVNTPNVEWLLGTIAGENATWKFQPRDDGNYAINFLTPYNGGTAYITTGLSQSLFSLGAGSTTAQHINISSSGNVGIGTIAPAYKLDVSGSARITNGLTVTGSTILNNGQTTIRGAGATSATTTLLVQNSTPTNIITVLDNGTVGILRAPTASLDIAGTTRISGSFNTAISGSILTVIGSGSTQPIFTVQGSQGELFSITDSLSGSLFSVNDISGLPILEVFSDSTTLIGDYQDPMLITTKKVTMTNSGSFVVYSLPTASYDTAFFDYSIKSGSNARAGQIMAIQSGTSVNFTETTTTDFGNTTAVSFTVIVSGSNMVLTGSAATGSWTIKSIIRGL